MGYDIYQVRPRDPEGEAAAVTEAREHWDAAVRALDAIDRSLFHHVDGQYRGRTAEAQAAQDALMAASGAMDAARASYYRLNVWGMSATAAAMSELGMLVDASPSEAWPKMPDGITWMAVEQVSAWECGDGPPPVLTATQVTLARDYMRREAAHLAAHPGEEPGIPVHKINGSNDGWHVLPAEIQAALAVYEARLAAGATKPDLVWWDSWLDFLKRSIETDGFKVR